VSAVVTSGFTRTKRSISLHSTRNGLNRFKLLE
jgi:hypothetical protein